MQQSKDTHIFSGLQMDNDATKQSKEFLTDAHNIRIETRNEGENLLISSERGSLKCTLINEEEGENIIKGKYIGHCVLNSYLVLFTVDSKVSRIYRLKRTETGFSFMLLYEGDLGFNLNNKLVTLGSFENDLIQKIYWTDNVSQPRTINITYAELIGKEWKTVREDIWNDNSFNFVPELQLLETVYVSKLTSTAGGFPAGTVQYAISYYNKYGQESNIAWVSPLYYTSFTDRAGSPEESIGNAFKIKIFSPDKNFEYIRIYSIVRTSYEATPTVKILVDLSTTLPESTSPFANWIEFIDDNTQGEAIDPTTLLYIGGEEILAKGMCQKDGTLFLGNIVIQRPEISNELQESLRKGFYDLKPLSRPFNSYDTSFSLNATNSYVSRDSYDASTESPLTFKCGETYRLGIQFQYKTGKWSEPIFIKDVEMTSHPQRMAGNYDYLMNLPAFSGAAHLQELLELGYKKVRGVVVLPSIYERKVVLQGVLCPTVYNIKDRLHNTPHAQSSWFIRPFDSSLEYKHGITLKAGYNKYAEIQGVPEELSSKKIEDGKYYGIKVCNEALPATINSSTDMGKNYKVKDEDMGNVFAVDQSILTLHSPDIQWDDSISALDLSNLKLQIVGHFTLDDLNADITIQTSSGPINPEAAGFTIKPLKDNRFGYNAPAPSDFLYEDGIATVYDDGKDGPQNYKRAVDPSKFFIYPWFKSGSLNNDCVRAADKGTRTSVLKKKILSYSRIGAKSPTWYSTPDLFETESLGLFDSDELSVVKLKDKLYYGNVDTVLTPVVPYGSIFKTTLTNKFYSGGDTIEEGDPEYNKTYIFTHEGAYQLIGSDTGPSVLGTTRMFNDIASFTSGDWERGLFSSREGIRMKYKSTPHIVLDINTSDNLEIKRDLYSYYNAKGINKNNTLFLAELVRDNAPTFGGSTDNAIENNQWLPAGPAIDIVDLVVSGTGDQKLMVKGPTYVKWYYGDTYYQRYECLKTYAFTPEDENQIIDIVSFMCESRINCDGRYDKNKGLVSNLYMSPKNFNLHNPVYNQKDNFFKYRRLDDDFHKIVKFPNSITWSLEKKSAMDVDPWTNITMASILDLDGDKGEISALKTFDNKIYAFQQRGISDIMFNSRVQLNTSDGVPIEISNNYKVEGSRYITENLGTSQKDNICATPTSIYFIDDQSKDLYSIGGQGLTNVSGTHAMSSWFNQIKDHSELWYDFNRSDLYIKARNTVLNFSERLSQFVSFFDYENLNTMVNVGDGIFGISSSSDSIKIDKLMSNGYKSYIGTTPNYSFTFISNSDAAVNKIFTNIDVRGDWFNSDGTIDHDATFSSLRVWNEYQDTGEQNIEYHRVSSTKGFRNTLARKKFRVWRFNIPRAKRVNVGTSDNPIYANRARDRISNMWCKIQFKSKKPMFIHDLDVQYFV